MRRTLALAAAGAALVLAGCGGALPGKIFKDPHGTIEVRKGAAFAIQLEVNSGVGFDWRLIPLRIERSPLEEKESETSYPDENRAGQSGRKLFHFVATQPGRQTLVFEHVFRGRPRERRHVVVVIRPS
jgi:predicted secreted protein